MSLRNYIINIFEQIRPLNSKDLEKIENALKDTLNWEFQFGTTKISSTEQLSVKNDVPLKLIYLLGVFPSTYHGGGQRTRDIISSFVDKNRVDLYSVVGEEIDQNFSDFNQSLSMTRFVSSNSFGQKDLELWLRSRNIPKKYYDVAHLKFPASIELIATMKEYSKKICYSFVECISRRQMMDFLDFGTFSLQQILNTLRDELYAIEMADIVLATTNEELKFLNKIHPESKKHLLPTCLSDSFLTISTLEKTSKSDVTGIFLGNYDHPPNIEGLIWYFDNVHDKVIGKYRNFKLSIVGAGPLDKITEICKKFPEVKIVGKVESLEEELNRADIALAPIISGGGIRGKILQYSYFGCAVVSTSLGIQGLEKYVHGKSLLIADDQVNFALELEKLIANEAYRKIIGENGKKVVLDHYCWPLHLKKLEEIYHS